MKTKSILALATAMFCTIGIATAQAKAQTNNIGRCGLPRGSCGNICDGSGFMNQGRGNGSGNGQGMRRGPRDGNGNGAGNQRRDRKRDGSGPGCKKGS